MDRSWKTTVLGILTAAFAFVIFDPQWFPLWMVSLAKFAAVGGLAGLGIMSKDHDMTGGPKGTNPTIIGLLIVGLLIMPGIAQAQTPSAKFIFAGVSFNQANSPQFQGFGGFGIPVLASVLSFTYYDVGVIPVAQTPGKITLPKLQYAITTGIAMHVYDLSPKVSIWGLGGAGISTTGDTTGGSFNGGGFLHVSFGKSWGALLILQVDKSAPTGAQFTPRIGIRYEIK